MVFSKLPPLQDKPKSKHGNRNLLLVSILFAWNKKQLDKFNLKASHSPITSGLLSDRADLGHCSMCDLKENLWLCLTCGNLGCGRSQFGGVGGKSHGVAHTKETNHPVAVKLGSITSDGTADVYCYSCNEERVDTELAAHLSHWGINIAEREKTEKSLTELQIEHNMKYDFSMTTEDGKEFQPIFGEGFTGLKNLGNSCYLASTLQCLFSLPSFQQRYYLPKEQPIPMQNPADDLETQLRKVADGLLSGLYSKPDTDIIISQDSSEKPHQKGLAPSMLKYLIGKDHEEFATMKQQDAFELLLHLLKLITRTPHTAQFTDPVHSFRFVMEQRLQCVSCKKVRYRQDEQDNISIPVPVRRLQPQNQSDSDEPPKVEFESVTLKECLDIFTGAEHVELTCPSCSSKDGFLKRSLFKTLPTTLIINARRFELVNWVPTKLDIPVVVGDETFNLDDYLSPGHLPTEEILPEIDDSPKWTPNPASLSQLEAMGFPLIRCEKALHATGNSDNAEAATNWLFSHMEDADIDTPINFNNTSTSINPATTTTTTTPQINPESIETLANMGIPTPQARKALRETNGDVNRALDWVFSHPDDQGDFSSDTDTTQQQQQQQQPQQQTPAQPQSIPGSPSRPAKYTLSSIICHKGASIHAGHYVAFVRKVVPGAYRKEGGKEGVREWVLYNDEKVVRAVDVEEMKKFAYVYFFEREG